MQATAPKKVTEVKKALGFYFKDQLKALSCRHTWSQIKCNEKRRELVLTTTTDDPSLQSLRDFAAQINVVISQDWPGCDIKMRLAVFSIRLAGEAAQ